MALPLCVGPVCLSSTGPLRVNSACLAWEKGTYQVTGAIKLATKQTGNKASSIAGKVLGGAKPTQAQVKTLAASVLSQDEKKGRR